MVVLSIFKSVSIEVDASDCDNAPLYVDWYVAAGEAEFSGMILKNVGGVKTSMERLLRRYYTERLNCNTSKLVYCNVTSYTLFFSFKDVQLCSTTLLLV